MNKFLAFLLVVWPYLPLPICYVPGEELRNQVFVIDVLLMLTTSMYGINAIVRAFREKKMTGKSALVNTVLHFFFVTDIISSVVVFCKIRKHTE